MACEEQKGDICFFILGCSELETEDDVLARVMLPG